MADVLHFYFYQLNIFNGNSNIRFCLFYYILYFADAAVSYHTAWIRAATPIIFVPCVELSLGLIPHKMGLSVIHTFLSHSLCQPHKHGEHNKMLH